MEKLVLPFVFEELNRSRLTFSDSSKIRLNPSTNKIELKEQSKDPVTGDPIYSTSDNLWMKTWIANPLAVEQWLLFNAEPYAQPIGTSVKFKLNNGTSDYYFNGISWVIAGASNWNTATEVCANISTFDSNSKMLAIVVNLKTTDENKTPTLTAVDVLMNCDLDYGYMYSLIAASLIPKLREMGRVTVEYAIDAEGGANISLQGLEINYNIYGIVAAYNHSTDPDHNTNILQAYDSTSKVITLSTSVVRGTSIWILLTVEPEIYLNWGSQDYLELDKIPAIVLESFDVQYFQNYAEASVNDMPSYLATVRRFPLRLRISFEVVLLAEKNRTLLALLDSMLRFAGRLPVLVWKDLDQGVSLKVGRISFTPKSNLEDKHEASLTMLLDNVYIWIKPDEQKPLVQRFVLGLTPQS